jgi:hypothetical protein
MRNCCESAGSTKARCTTTCEENLCNSNPIDASAATLDALPRCIYYGNDTHMICNTCEMSDQHCVDRPNSAYVNQVPCVKETHYCTVKHMVYLDNLTNIYSYQRACHPKDSEKYGVTDDTVFRTWICHCSYDYCNDNIDMGTELECHNGAETKAKISLTWRTLLSLSAFVLLVGSESYI